MASTDVVSAAARVVLAVALLSALGTPAAARAERSLLDRPLRAPGPSPSLAVFPAGVLVALAPEEESRPERPAAAREGEAKSPSLDFDLLGEAKPPPEPAEAGALRLRRRMLTVHQGIGLGLLGLQVATTAVGQLNYSDRFVSDQDTARYKLPHRYLAYATLGAFAVNGGIALLAPSAKTPRKLDRVMVHRVAMFTAAGGMVAQAILGIQTRERVGRLDQERLATTHLVVGYATLAAVLAGVGALVL